MDTRKAILLPDTSTFSVTDRNQINTARAILQGFGGKPIDLTEEPAYEFFEQFVKTPRRVFIEWEDGDV